MSTTFLHSAILCLALGACAHAPRIVYQAVPAPPDSGGLTSSGEARTWEKVRVSDAYGSFEMRVPVLRLARATGSAALVIDSIALLQVEKRMSARIARVARAEAALVHSDTVQRPRPVHDPAPEIRPGLLGSLTFEADTAAPSDAARQRIAAVARLARDLPGDLEVSASINGTGPTMLDAALVRARQVYLALIADEPSLAERAVVFSLHTHPGLPGGSRTATTVSIFAASQR